MSVHMGDVYPWYQVTFLGWEYQGEGIGIPGGGEEGWYTWKEHPRMYTPWKVHPYQKVHPQC